MRYESNGLYHLLNRGTEGRVIFPQTKNYSFFEQKLIKHIVPYADILAYCLMPNHFHLLIRVNKAGEASSTSRGFVGNQQNLSSAMGTTLSSYSRAINRQEKRQGTLFSSATKVIPCWYQGCQTVDDALASHKNRHADTCLHYIHTNPVKASLCKQTVDWPYSSAKYYAKETDHVLARVSLAKVMGII